MTLPASYGSVVTMIQTLPDEYLLVENVKMRLLDHEVKLSEQNKDTAAKALIAAIIESDKDRTRDMNYKRQPNFQKSNNHHGRHNTKNHKYNFKLKR